MSRSCRRGRGLVRARDELAPRRTGQLEFAMRRECRLGRLRGCVVLETTVGSRAWGLATEHLTPTCAGIRPAPSRGTLGLVEPPRRSRQRRQQPDALGKFRRRSSRARARRPEQFLEMLFQVPGSAASDPDRRVARRAVPVSKQIFGSFGRYALSQLDKLSSVRSAWWSTEISRLPGCRRAYPDLDGDAAVERDLSRTRPPPTPSSERRRTSSSSTARCDQAARAQRLRSARRIRARGWSPSTRVASCARRTPTICCA